MNGIYSEAYARGEVEKNQQAPVYYAAGAVAGGVTAAHYVGKVEIPKDLKVFNAASDAAREQLRNGGTAYQAASTAKSTIKTGLDAGKQSVNTTLETLGKAIKDAPKNSEADKALLKTLKSERALVRAGKWGAIAGAAFVTGSVFGAFGGEKAKRRSERAELSNGWVGYEESRRGMGGGLAR